MADALAKEEWFEQAKASITDILERGWSATSMHIYFPIQYHIMLRQLPVADENEFEAYIVSIRPNNYSLLWHEQKNLYDIYGPYTLKFIGRVACGDIWIQCIPVRLSPLDIYQSCYWGQK